MAATLGCAAQNYFEPGYIVNPQNDTIKGFILDSPDADHAIKIFFKPDQKTTPKIYKPKDLSGFGFNSGRIFEKMPVISEKDTTYIFAKNLVRGKIDLFVWRHPNIVKPDIFLSNNETNKTVHLIKPEKKIFPDNNGKSYTQRDDQYFRKLQLIKEDSVLYDNRDIIKFSENRIKRDILDYNKQFQSQYKIKKYVEKVNYDYDIIAGLPVNSSEDLHFRAGLYRNKSREERSTNFSLMQGLVYNHWSNDDKELPAIQDGNSNYRWQLLNVVPLGINFHGNSKNIQPYGYAAIGAAVIMMKDHVIKGGVQQENETSFSVIPTVNFGVGTKIRLGKNFLIAELTPTITGLFWNVGFSI